MDSKHLIDNQSTLKKCFIVLWHCTGAEEELPEKSNTAMDKNNCLSSLVSLFPKKQTALPGKMGFFFMKIVLQNCFSTRKWGMEASFIPLAYLDMVGVKCQDGGHLETYPQLTSPRLRSFKNICSGLREMVQSPQCCTSSGTVGHRFMLCIQTTPTSNSGNKKGTSWRPGDTPCERLWI